MPFPMRKQSAPQYAYPQSFHAFTNMRPSALRTLGLYTCISLSVLLALVLFATRGLPPFAEDGIHSFSYPRPPPARPVVAHEDEQPYSGGETDGRGDGAPEQTSPGSWRFDYARDGKNYGLSEDQCDLAFPALYKEVDRAVAHRRAIGKNVSLEDVDVGWRGDGIVRAMVRDSQLYIIDAHGVRDHNHRPRSIATLHSLQRAITAFPGKLPDVEFTLTDHDSALVGKSDNHTTWSYARLPKQETLWLMPDFGLWGWPEVGMRSYAELQSVLDENEDDFLDKTPKLVWRGALGNAGGQLRRALIKESTGQDWSDVQSFSWKNKTDLNAKLLSMEDHCAYMFVAQTEGNTYSGRLKYLLNCHSIVLSHELRWIEHFHHLLIPSGVGQNFVKLRRDFSDLRSAMRRLLNPDYLETTARGIADNARATFREKYLTPAANACYWRAMIRGWASVQGFEPQGWIEEEEVEDGQFVGIGSKKARRRRPRGTPFEAYAIMEVTEWSLPAKPRVVCVEEDKEAH